MEGILFKAKNQLRKYRKKRVAKKSKIELENNTKCLNKQLIDKEKKLNLMIMSLQIQILTMERFKIKARKRMKLD